MSITARRRRAPEPAAADVSRDCAGLSRGRRTARSDTRVDSPSQAAPRPSCPPTRCTHVRTSTLTTHLYDGSTAVDVPSTLSAPPFERIGACGQVRRLLRVDPPGRGEAAVAVRAEGRRAVRLRRAVGALDGARGNGFNTSAIYWEWHTRLMDISAISCFTGRRRPLSNASGSALKRQR